MLIAGSLAGSLPNAHVLLVAQSLAQSLVDAHHRQNPSLAKSLPNFPSPTMCLVSPHYDVYLTHGCDARLE